MDAGTPDDNEENMSQQRTLVQFRRFVRDSRLRRAA
jgi:hypothetical protein